MEPLQTVPAKQVVAAMEAAARGSRTGHGTPEVHGGTGHLFVIATDSEGPHAMAKTIWDKEHPVTRKTH